MSLLLDEGRARSRRPTRRTYLLRRAAALGGLVLFVAVAAVLVRAVDMGRGPAVDAPAAPGLTGPSGNRDPAPADRWDGYAETRAPREERIPIRFRRREAPAAGLVFDVRTGAVLWSRRPLARRRIASLTKMMTAIIVADRVPRGQKVKITANALDYEGSGVGLFRRGMRVDVDTMLYGLLLPSGNDAAIALAEKVSGTHARFVALMNARARALGLSCTRFSSASGIVDRGNASCARDLARLAFEVLRRPRLRAIVGTQYGVRRFPHSKRRRLYVTNHNTLMSRGYPGVTGVKTGYTDAAGSCLVGTARRGRHLGVVLLDSPDTGRQGARLLDAGFRRTRRN